MVLFNKPPDPMMDIFDGQTFDQKIRMDVRSRMNVIPV